MPPQKKISLLFLWLLFPLCSATLLQGMEIEDSKDRESENFRKAQQVEQNEKIDAIKAGQTNLTGSSSALKSSFSSNQNQSSSDKSSLSLQAVKVNNLQRDKKKISQEDPFPMTPLNISSTQEKTPFFSDSVSPSLKQEALPPGDERQKKLKEALLAEIRSRGAYRGIPTSRKITPERVTRVNFKDVSDDKTMENQPSNIFKDKEEFKKSIRTLMNGVGRLQTAMNTLSGNINDSEKIAALFEEARPQMKESLRALLLLASEHPKGINKAGMIYEKASPEIKNYLQILLGEIAADCQVQDEEGSLLATIKLTEIAFFLGSLKAEAHAIPKEDSDKPNKVTALYREAYTQQREKLQVLLKDIENGEVSLDQTTALDLSSMAIKVIETAFKSVDRKKIRPFQLQEGMEYPVIKARKLNYDLVPYESVDAEDMSSIWLLEEAENAISNAKNIIKALLAPATEKEFALYHSRLMKASSASYIALMKECEANRKLAALASEGLPGALEEARQEVKKADVQYQQKSEEVAAIRQLSLMEEKERVSTDIVDIANVSLNLSNELIVILTSKVK